MISLLKHYITVGFHFIKMSVQTTLEYPVNLIGWLLANPVQFVLGLATIKFVVAEFGTLNGWEFGDLAFLYGLAVMSHGLSVLLFVQTWFMGGILLRGSFDIFMLRPMNVLFQFFFMIFNLIGITDMIPGTIIFIYGCNQINFQWTIINTIAVITILIGATLIRGALFLITGSMCFWTKSYYQFTEFNLKMLDQTTKYPLSMYPRIIQTIFTFIIPLGFISFYPASYFIGKTKEFPIPNGIVWATLFVGIFVFFVATRVFRLGLTKYESAGT